MYQEISLIGFSLGGNLTLKYLGERGTTVPPVVKKATVFSVPMDLHTSCLKLSHPVNWIYARRFLASLKKKVKQKAQFRNEIGIQGIDRIDNLLEFDDRYTAPIHGFNGALHYYRECSSVRFVHAITVPCLIVNALNDPFLTPECFPADLLRDHAYVALETPSRGGHVGFSLFNKNGLYWSEIRALAFLAP
jgi:predicted alpha/beta-fold hydrolase